jgi:hypothetical protein
VCVCGEEREERNKSRERGNIPSTAWKLANAQTPATARVMYGSLRSTTFPLTCEHVEHNMYTTKNNSKTQRTRKTRRTQRAIKTPPPPPPPPRRDRERSIIPGKCRDTKEKGLHSRVLQLFADTHTLSFSLFPSLMHPHTHTHIFACTHSHTHTCANALARTFTRSFSFTLPLSCTHTLTHSHSLTHMNTHTLSLSLSLSPTHVDDVVTMVGTHSVFGPWMPVFVL